MRMKNRALFLDRDGVINKPLIINGKLCPISKIKDLQIYPYVKDAIQEAKKLHLIVIVFTNQPDVARGILRMKDVEKIHRYIQKKLLIDDIFTCPHDDNDNCNCRKPKPGMLYEAAKKWNINLQESFVVGDRWKDIAAGKSVGCTTFLIRSEYNKEIKIDYDYLVDDLYSAVKIIVDKLYPKTF